MSDISIQFPWWFGVLVVLGSLFWPLTAVGAAAATWLWFARSRLAVRIVTIPLLVLWAISASFNILGFIDNWRSQARLADDLRSRQRTLSEPARIAGIMLPPQTVVTHRYGGGPDDIETLDLPKPAGVHGIPLIGHVQFDDTGRIDGTVTLARDTSIDGIPCAAMGDTMVLKGRLASCKLSRRHTVGGIPCSGALDVTAGVRCTLAAPYRCFGVAWRPQTSIDDSPLEGKTWFTIGPAAPSLRVLGTALPESSNVEFTHGRISNINLGTRRVRYGGNAISMIDVRGAVIQGQIERGDFNEPPRHVALPASAIQLR